MSAYPTVGITIKSDFDEHIDALHTVIDIIQRAGSTVLIDAKRTERLAIDKDLGTYSTDAEIDLLLVMGGDGTILRTIREMEDFTTPILSVNRGTVGFLAETELDEAETLLPELLTGNGIIDERELLHISTMRGADVVHEGIALNEAVIAQGMIARLVNLQTTINEEALTTFHADGLIISTPTGSTAYSLSAGGPIVHPNLSAMILTPINPHSFAQKPIVVRGDATVSVQVLMKESKFSDASSVLTIDGQIYVPLHNKDTITVTKSEKTVKFLRRKQDTFFGTLREKLKWGERVDD